MSVDTATSRLAEREMVKARIAAEVAAVRAAGLTAEAFDRVRSEHPEDALQVAYRLSGTGGAK